MTQVSLPRYEVPLLDARGNLNAVWFRYFTDLFNRVGGGDATDLGPLTILLTDAINQVNGLQTASSDQAAQRALQQIEELQNRVERMGEVTPQRIEEISTRLDGLAQAIRRDEDPEEPQTVRDLRQRAEEIEAQLLNRPIIVESLPLNAISAFAAFSSVGQAIAAGAATKLIFGTEEFDELSEFDPVTSEFRASVAGLYVFNAGVEGTQAAIANRALNIFVNGLQRKKIQQSQTETGQSELAGTSGPIKLNAGDLVTVSHVTLVADTTRTGQPFTYFGGYRIK